MSGAADNPAEIAAELARLRTVEQALRADCERIREAAADEVMQLQAALRETAARAAQRDRDVERLTSQLEKAAGSSPSRWRGGLQLGRPQLRRGEPDTAGSVARVLATFELERKRLEERARAVAETETRQRATDAELGAEAERLASLGESLEERGRLSAELERSEQQRREVEVALVAARTRLSEVERGVVPARPDSGAEEQHEREEEAQIAVVLARREDELERRRNELETEAHAELTRREQELAERLSREQARLREEIAAREFELARREEDVTRREIELSVVRRRVGDEERRLQERGWRTGGPAQRAPLPVVAHRPHDLTFSEGWRRLADAHGGERADGGG